MAALANIPKEQIVYVDEAGIDIFLNREYARSSRGEPVYSRTPGKKYKRTGIVAAQINEKRIAPLQYSGAMDSSLFETWFITMLIPTLKQSTVIVMDNASFHRKSRLISIAESCIAQ